jgi:uncharacterized protein
MRTRLIFLVGGPDFHPVNAQAGAIISWLGPHFACHTADSLAAFEHLMECDLLVLMGQHWTGFEGRYRSPSDVHRKNFEKYVQSGRPILSAHGGIASYDDWPRFSELIGFRLHWESARPSPVGEYQVQVRPSGHPIVDGVPDFQLHDELLPDVQILSPTRTHVLADAYWHQRKLPAIMFTQGGRLLGAGKSVYIGLGHDMQSLQSPQLQHLWLNAVRWCLREE